MNYDADLKVTKNNRIEITPEVRERYPDLPPGYYIEIAGGHVFNDKKGRFRDGEFITTSWIVEETDEYIQTLNTLYRKIG